MILILQGDYNVSQPKRTSLQRHSTLKLPSLYYQVSLSSTSISKSAKNTYIVVFSCQNCVTFCQIVTRLVCTTQGTTNLILKTCPTSRKSCHVFLKSCHDWTPCKTCSLPAKIVTRFFSLPNFIFESHCNIYEFLLFYYCILQH